MPSPLIASACSRESVKDQNPSKLGDILDVPSTLPAARTGSVQRPALSVISQEWLPDSSKERMDFLESSFFQTPGRELPSPPDVNKLLSDTVVIPEMKLLIKCGPHVTIDEAITMWAVRKCLGHQIPVPELFGWRTSGDTVFIYMELIAGVTVHEAWGTMTLSDKESLSDQLHQMLSALRQLKQEDDFVGEHEMIGWQGFEGFDTDRFESGSITRGPLLDRVFYYTLKAGPFKSLDDFYTWLEWLPQRFLEPHQRYTDPYLERMPNDTTIKFTHADVHPKNIMVSPPDSGPLRILALIDWGQSGWYPDYWEYFKMCYTTHWEDEWRKTWIPKIVEPRDDEHYLMAEYTQTIGAV